MPSAGPLGAPNPPVATEARFTIPQGALSCIREGLATILIEVLPPEAFAAIAGRATVTALEGPSSGLASAALITVDEFAGLARLSRRQIDRLRQRRPQGFPREYELGSGGSKYRRCPRFKLAEVQRWLDSRALW